mmetsp:Transcript_25877/g.65521  ORF Transcript_25877/g.65521 Transcript_25877/m.65521 type:complete len:300 (+) Transcript_25877:3094-3993(+)
MLEHDDAVRGFKVLAFDGGAAVGRVLDRDFSGRSTRATKHELCMPVTLLHFKLPLCERQHSGLVIINNGNDSHRVLSWHAAIALLQLHLKGLVGLVLVVIDDRDGDSLGALTRVEPHCTASSHVVLPSRGCAILGLVRHRYTVIERAVADNGDHAGAVTLESGIGGHLERDGCLFLITFATSAVFAIHRHHAHIGKLSTGHRSTSKPSPPCKSTRGVDTEHQPVSLAPHRSRLLACELFRNFHFFLFGELPLVTTSTNVSHHVCYLIAVGVKYSTISIFNVHAKHAEVLLLVHLLFIFT